MYAANVWLIVVKNSDPPAEPLIKDISTLIQFILTQNYFIFNCSLFLQVNEMAMGTKMAPSYANIFMAVL